MRNSIVEPSRQTPVVHEVDVVICGGGPAGIAAAIASAETGAKTVLLELTGCLGGVWTAGLLSYVLDPKPESPVTRMLLAELESYGAKNKRHNNEALRDKYYWAKHSFIYDPEVMKLVLEQECIKRGVQIQLHTRVCDVSRSENGKKIEAVITESKSGRQAWKAPVFIDTTGDGDLAAQAGCRFAIGRPESGEVQPMSLMFVLSTPYPERVGALSWGSYGSLLRELTARGVTPSYGAPVLFHIREGLFACMMNHHYASGLDAAEMTRATIEARKEIHEMMGRLNAHGDIWEGARVVATGAQIGVREGRRIQGLYEVTVDDLIEGRVHEDAICKVTFPVDVHSTSKEGGKPFDDDNKITSKPYDVPLRALIASDVDNLIMAGRCISGDFWAHASYRVTGNSIQMGEAAGCLAALAAAEKAAPSAVEWTEYASAFERLSLSAPPVPEGDLAAV